MPESKWVYSSGVSSSDTAVPGSDNHVGVGTDSRVHQLQGIPEPEPGRKYTFQRGLAKAALKSKNLSERERISQLSEALAMMGLLERVMPKFKE